MRRIAALVLLWLLGRDETAARLDRELCGTHPEKLNEEMHLHRQAVRSRHLRAALSQRVAAPARPASRDVGDIVVLEESDGVVGRRNPFNLDQQTLEFLPAAGATRYRFQVSAASYDRAAAAAGTRLAGMEDDDTRQVSLPFAFPFFSASYRQMFVNSDGNLTFTASDTSTSERSLGRVTAGPPRIAPLFRDLDPSLSTSGIRVLAEPERLVVSWVDVPEYAETGVGPLQTFQARLYPNGRIEFAWAGSSSQDAVVGISPGRLQGSSSVVSFSSGGAGEYSSTLVERFSGSVDLDTVVASQKFYETHEDAYDYLVFFNNLDIDAAPSAVAWETTVHSDRKGIGDTAVDVAGEYGSRGRLQAVINMGPLSQYPANPYALVPRRAFSRDTTMSVLAHEAGHLFLAFASIRDPADPRARPMLCSDRVHWSFAFNSDASLVSGNRIQDLGAEASPRFRTVATVEAYSALDQYLMGLRPPDDIPPTFLVTRSTVSASSCVPVPGVSFDGVRQDITVQDVIQAEGRRTPDHTVSQKRFRFAFVLVVGKDAEPPASQLAQLDDYRREFETFFRRSSSERAVAETSLRRVLKLSTFPAAGVLAGRTLAAAVSIERPLATPLEVALRTRSGAASVPASFRIGAGATRAAFTLRGERAGVDELTAEPADSRWETAVSSVQVSPGLSALRVVAVSGDRQIVSAGAPLTEPIVVRAVDDNNLPYPGLRILASVSAGGSVSPAAAVSDDNGVARFVWTPGPGPLNEFRAALEGAAAPATPTAVAIGKPYTEARAVVNAASYAPGISPGCLATIFGLNLVGGRVTLGGRAATVLYSGDRQINFVVPPELGPGDQDLVITTSAGASTPVRLSLRPFSPGIFGVIWRAGVIEIFATGLGAVRPSSYQGLFETVETPQVFVGGRPAEVTFSGLAPLYDGLYQVNARLPSEASPLSDRVVILIGGERSNEGR